jgi:uncharacterized membrane protein
VDEIGFLLVVGLILLAVPVLGLVGFFRTLSLRRQIETLEARLLVLESRQGLAALPLASSLSPDATGPGEPASEAVQQAGPPVAAEVPEAPEELPVAAFSPIAEEAGATPPPPAAPPSPGDGTAPVPPRSLEELIGTRWVVWVGGLALGLGGIFLVRYSIEQGWFGPGARIACGALFALALAAAGEVLRRRERAGADLPAFGQIPAAHIPSVLTAAGTLSAFATVYAAHALYDMLGAGPAFVLLGIIGLATMAAAALHGPVLAGFGLVASYAAPGLVSSGDPQPWPVVLYCVVVAAAAYGLARIRGWPWLALATAAGAALWARLILDLGDHDAEAATHIAVQSGLAAVLLGVGPHRGRADREASPDWLGTGVLLVFAWLAGDLLAGGSWMAWWLAGDVQAEGPAGFDTFGAGRVVFAAAEIAILGMAGLMAAPVAAALLAAGAVAVATLFGWPILAELASQTQTSFPAPGTVPPLPDAIWLFLVFGAIAGALILAAGFLRLLRAEGLPRLPAGFYAAAAVLTPAALLVTAWWRVTAFDRSIPFALVAALLGLVHVAAARQLDARVRATGPADPDASLAAQYGMEAFAAGAIGALAAGLTMVLDKGALTVALALSALGSAWVTTRQPMSLLRYAVGALGLAVASRLAWDPGIVEGDPGSTPILNWLLWGYGVPAICFGFASRLLRRQADDQVVALCEALSIAFTGLLLAFELHHLATGGRMWSPNITHLEVGLQATAALMMAVVLVSLEVTRRSLVIRVASYIFGGASLGLAVLGLLLIDNPLLNGSGEAVQGGSVFNSLLAAYLLTAVAAFVLARRARGRRPAWFVGTARLLGFALALTWVVLEIRRLFQGPLIGIGHRTSDAEFYTYSAAFLGIGLLLLAWGILRGSREARLASAAFILLAVVKAFLFDMSGLTGAYRALSFIGLGLVLVGIGLVYQKLVFRPGASSPPASLPPAPPPEGPGDGAVPAGQAPAT